MVITDPKGSMGLTALSVAGLGGGEEIILRLGTKTCLGRSFRLGGSVVNIFTEEGFFSVATKRTCAFYIDVIYDLEAYICMSRLEEAYVIQSYTNFPLLFYW